MSLSTLAEYAVLLVAVAVLAYVLYLVSINAVEVVKSIMNQTAPLVVYVSKAGITVQKIT